MFSYKIIKFKYQNSIIFISKSTTADFRLSPWSLKPCPCQNKLCTNALSTLSGKAVHDTEECGFSELYLLFHLHLKQPLVLKETNYLDLLLSP